MRQIRDHGINLPAQVVEDRPHDLVTFLEIDSDNRNACPRFTDNVVDLRHFLCLLLDLVSNEVFYALRTGARELSGNKDCPDDESWIMRLGN